MRASFPEQSAPTDADLDAAAVSLSIPAPTIPGYGEVRIGPRPDPEEFRRVKLAHLAALFRPCALPPSADEWRRQYAASGGPPAMARAVDDVAPAPSSLSIFTCNFTGHWPVGACAVVVAPNLAAAKSALGAELAGRGLALRDDDEWVEVPMVAGVRVLLDGEY